jgi:hypothetical protein
MHQCCECSARAVLIVLLVVRGEGCAREMPVHVVLVELLVCIRVEAGAHSCNHVLVRVRSEFAERARASKRT